MLLLIVPWSSIEHALKKICCQSIQIYIYIYKYIYFLFIPELLNNEHTVMILWIINSVEKYQICILGGSLRWLNDRWLNNAHIKL